MVGVMRSEFSSVFDSIGCAMVREYGLQKTHVTSFIPKGSLPQQMKQDD